ncbi:MAG: serine hydrolase domain-containing protein [Flavobacteriaceae bacterium]|nr:serine hydrolase domain-containing protein [Flavobacteriaceae bacterium]
MLLEKPLIEDKKGKKLQQILDKAVDNKRIFGTSFALKKDDYYWQGASGNLEIDQAYFIASTTKLFATAIIYRLFETGELKPDHKLGDFFDEIFLYGLHIFEDDDCASHISIKQLLSHTSGLPDYFQDKGSMEKSLEQELISGKDQIWTFEDVIIRVKMMNSYFVPGAKNKGHYADTNFQILGKIIELVTGKSFDENCNEMIINPLNLSNTYIYRDIQDENVSWFYYKEQELKIPKAMTSFGIDGGMVSTSADMIVFLEAFFGGKLFSEKYISQMQEWNPIFFPFKSGVGIQLFRLPWYFNPVGSIPDFIGHSGLSGALAFYAPQENIFISGTVNQLSYNDLSFRLMIKLIQNLLKTKKE